MAAWTNRRFVDKRRRSRGTRLTAAGLHGYGGGNNVHAGGNNGHARLRFCGA
jgi:hypothetical protein